ncbi:MAG: transcription elongation factor GreA [Bacteriovoracaceae bacterium]|nr:transcription elongation factor GreA [Bacteriovoracaceae bacterium]
MSDFPMTIKGKQQLEAELEKLIRIDREEIKKAIQEARELGDLKENAEYHAAREKQSHNEGRIADIQNRLAKAKVIDTTKLKGTRVVFGAYVVLYDQTKEETVEFQIVGEDESKNDPDKRSCTSPLCKALIGKEEGDEVIVKAPKGNLNFTIESVSFK